MVQFLVQSTLLQGNSLFELSGDDSLERLYEDVSVLSGVPREEFLLRSAGGEELDSLCSAASLLSLEETDEDNAFMVVDFVLPLCGGIDFQHREGGKTGSGGQLSESQAALERKERLRKLALETIDISKDPYFFKNHVGTFECKLCLTLHPNEGNYLAHTQGKRHQYNIGRRAAMEAKNSAPKLLDAEPQKPIVKRVLKIGRPGYKVTKSRDLITRQRSITFEVDYPDVEEGVQPRHRFMSAYEQKVEAADKHYQYVLFACEPYETVAFKIPNQPIDKREGRFFTNWDKTTKKFVLQLFFVDGAINVPGVVKQ